MKYFKFTNETGLLPKEDSSFEAGIIYPGDKKVGSDNVQYFYGQKDTSADWEEATEEDYLKQQKEIEDKESLVAIKIPFQETLPQDFLLEEDSSYSQLRREDFPMFKCHKEVGALQITDINNRPAPLGTWCDATLSFGGVYKDIIVGSHWMIKNKPKVGGYFIVYEDGYTSYSPQEAFEKGYSKIEA